MHPTLRRVALAILLSLVLGACDTPPGGSSPATSQGLGVDAPSQGDLPSAGLFVLDGVGQMRSAVRAGAVRFAPEGANQFLRAGVRFDAPGGDPGVEARIQRDGAWEPWQPLPITWNEGGAFNGNLVLEASADALELRARRGLADEVSFLLVELFTDPLPEPTVDPVADEGGDEGEALRDGPFARTQHGLAPPGIVNLRSAWGARNTGTCGSAHTPSYLTIHHTVTPTNDSMTPQQRLRQIQAYHIDSNGWCDIGYHFLVSADGRLWQGRASHDRTGAHVGNHNTNNVGISFMGSYHVDQVPQAMIESTPELLGWFRDNYSIPLNRTRVLGHREWAGASTACPGGYLLPKLEEMIALASGPPADSDVSIKANWGTIAGQERDLVPVGSSAVIFDAIQGQEVTGRIVVRNGVDRPVTDDMIIGYWVESPYLEPLSYEIQTDAPARDGSTWVQSASHGRADNPPLDAPPAEGFIRVGEVAPGESVRIVFTLRANQYSIGAVDHPDLRGWVKHIGSYYGEQDGWNDDVENNGAGGWLRAYAQMDIFATDQWQFNGGDYDDVEGWSVMADVSELAVNTVDNALAAKSSGADPHIQSPPWTSIDAATQSKIVMRIRQHGGPQTGQLFWLREGEGFVEARSVDFDVAGDTTYQVIELDLSDHAEWTGTIKGLRVDPWDGGPFDGAAAWSDIDYLLAAEGEKPDPPVDADGDGYDASSECDDTDAQVNPGATEVCDGKDNDCNGETDEGGVCDPDVDPDADTALPTDTSVPHPDATSDTWEGDAGAEPMPRVNVQDSCGCRSVGGQGEPSGPWWLLALVGVVFAVRRGRT